MIVLFILLLTLALALLVLIGAKLAPKSFNEAKERRFEAGNPPYGEVKRRLMMQYVGYIYMTTAVEALAGLMVVAALWRGAISIDLALTFAVVLVLVTIYVAKYLDKIADIRKWS